MRFNLRSDLPPAIIVNIQHRDERSHFRQSPRDAPPNPRSRAGDHRDLALEFHRSRFRSAHFWSQSRGIWRSGSSRPACWARPRTDGQDRQGRDLAYWRGWLVRLLERRVMEEVLANKISEREFDAIVAQVAARNKDPYSAVSEILSRSGH